MHTLALGLEAEVMAEKALLAHYPSGTRVLARNWRRGSRREIDRVLWEPGAQLIVFVEVRFRTHSAVGRYSALESLSWSKLQSLRRSVQSYLLARTVRERAQFPMQGMRVDLWWGAQGGEWQILRGLELPSNT